MFRVLSEEESKKVIRWQAPELGSSTAVVANTRQEAKPQPHKSDAGVRTLLGSRDLKAGHHQSPASVPRLQSISSGDVFANGAMLKAGSADNSTIQVSAELLQTSYDEGYSRGFAEGNAALHQQSISELGKIINALEAASRCPEDTDLEQELVSLSMDIARIVIRREITLAPEVMHDIVVAGLELLASDSTGQRVHLHPFDAAIVREQLSADSPLKVFDDPLLERGACHIESGSSAISAGIEDWLNNISTQLGVLTEASEQVVDHQSTHSQDINKASPASESDS
ncbi:MAG: FliH/SctL family protein [Granulosicoccus sp.]